MAATHPLFLPPVTYPSGGLAPNSVVLADVNGDGKPDIVVGNCASTSAADCGDGDGVVGVLLGKGDGTFRLAGTYSSRGSWLRGLTVADVNGDGRPDVVLTNCAPSGSGPCGRGLVGVLLGNGDGSFQSTVTYDSGGWVPLQVAVADVNGDGKLDVLVGNCGSIDCFVDHQKVAVLLGNGDGTFQPAITYDSGGRYPDGIAVADVNGDAKLDVVAVNIIDTSVGVLLGNGDGTFSTATTYSTGTHSDAYSLAIADVNADGQPDVLVSNCSLGFLCGGDISGVVSVLLGNGDSTFQPAVTYKTGGVEALSLAVADVNGDGKPDIVATNSYTSETVGVLLGNGDGTFKPSVTYSCGGECDAVALADVNGDGEPDVVVANSEPCYACGFIGSVGVLLNNSLPPDTTPPVITISAAPKMLWPANGKMTPVKVYGRISDTGSGVGLNSPTYLVKDEYGAVQPTAPISLDPSGNYSFTVLLQASRRGSDLDGRHYTVTVQAKDKAGNVGSKIDVVTVPHDQGD